MVSYFPAIFVCLLFSMSSSRGADTKTATQSDGTFRVFVSTDLGGDPDDIQSLVHLLHYTDVLRVEGIISSFCPGAKNDVNKIREWVKRTDLDTLRDRGHDKLMAEQDVLDVLQQGGAKPGFPGKNGGNEGSDYLIKCAKRESQAYLWVLAWGPLTDVAQALYDAPEISRSIRLLSIGGWNTKSERPAVISTNI
jgi:hypothetical protein